MQIKTIYLPACSTNCYLVADEQAKVCAIVDPGDPDPAILKTVEQEGWTVQSILLTHAHYDHTMGVPELRKALPEVPVLMHPGDAEMPKPFFRIAEMGPLTFFQDGEHLRVGEVDIQVIATPGHTAGSVTFLAGGDTLITGDTLFQGSMGRTDLPGGSYEAIMASLRRLACLEGDYRVLPGHMGESTLEAERQDNYYVKEAMGG